MDDRLAGNAARRRARRLLSAMLVAAMAGLAAASRAGDLAEVLDPARIGASKAEITEQLALQCEPAGPDQLCIPVATASAFAGLPVTAVQLTFVDARLAKVSVTLSDQHYEALRERLTAQFGPGEDHSFRARAGMGGEFVAGVYLWRTDYCRIVLEQFAGKIDRSALVYGTETALADLIREKTAYPAGARRDL